VNCFHSSFRNPSDVAVSGFHFYENWLYEKGKISVEEFVEWFYLKPCPPYDISWNAREMKFIGKSIITISFLKNVFVSQSIPSST